MGKIQVDLVCVHDSDALLFSVFEVFGLANQEHSEVLTVAQDGMGDQKVNEHLEPLNSLFY